MPINLNTARPNFTQLPQSYFIYLDQYSAISLTGEEQNKYLQGQVTCDVNALTEQGLMIGAHCNAKGKLLNVFRLLHRNNGFLLLQNQQSLTTSLAELKKFGVFSKVTIEQASHLQFFAAIGETAKQALQDKFQKLPDSLSPVIQVANTTLVYIAGNTSRYLLIDETEQLAPFINEAKLDIFEHAIWDLLEIQEGFPLVPENAVGEYVPQMLNLQAIDGISFTKGCYLGQETVARMQYLGKNKKALYLLNSDKALNLAEQTVVEKQLGDNWRRAGEVLAFYQADDGKSYLQAVLPNDLSSENNLRLKEHDDSVLNITALPYSLPKE